jgi:uncharacterized protein (TIGR03089 family)
VNDRRPDGAGIVPGEDAADRVPTPYELLLGRADRTRPFVTHYDAQGGRTELSVATAANAVAKAAGLLRDGLGASHGAVVSLDLPRHWQLPVWALAALSVGARVGRRRPEVVDVRLVGPDALAGLAAGGDPAADEVLVAACDAFGMPVPGGVPPGILDVGVEVRAHPDILSVEPGAASAAALEVGGRARPWPVLLAAHAPPGAGAGPRIWVDAAVPDPQLLLAGAVLPVLLAGSVVLDGGLPPDRVGATRAVEGVTAAAVELLG